MNSGFRIRGILACVLVPMLLPAAGCDGGPVALSTPGSPAEAKQSAPMRSTEILPLPFLVVDENGGPIDPVTTPASTPLFDARAYVSAGELVPVTAPDGDQVTWGEFSAIEGEISVKCIEQGTHVVLHLRNLIPNGVYDLWNVTFQAPGFTGAFDPIAGPANMIGLGPSGPGDGSRNAFRASASGQASISTITPSGALGTFGQIGSCAPIDEFEWHVVGFYHWDGQTHGSQIGPIGTAADAFGFVFRH